MYTADLLEENVQLYPWLVEHKHADDNEEKHKVLIALNNLSLLLRQIFF